MVDWKTIGAPFEKLFDNIWAYVGKSVSLLVAFTFMIFALGSLFGYFIAMHISLRQEIILLLLIPPLLGLIAYYYRTFAIICFIIFIILVLL